MPEALEEIGLEVKIIDWSLMRDVQRIHLWFGSDLSSIILQGSFRERMAQFQRYQQKKETSNQEEQRLLPPNTPVQHNWDNVDFLN